MLNQRNRHAMRSYEPEIAHKSAQTLMTSISFAEGDCAHGARYRITRVQKHYQQRQPSC